MSARSQASARNPIAAVGVLAVLCIVAGVLPWAMAGPAVAKGLGVPFLLVGVLAGVAVLLARRNARAPMPVDYPAAPAGGCRCGAGGCAAGQPAPGVDAAGQSAACETDARVEPSNP